MTESKVPNLQAWIKAATPNSNPAIPTKYELIVPDGVIGEAFGVPNLPIGSYVQVASQVNKVGVPFLRIFNTLNYGSGIVPDFTNGLRLTDEQVQQINIVMSAHKEALEIKREADQQELEAQLVAELKAQKDLEFQALVGEADDSETRVECFEESQAEPEEPKQKKTRKPRTPKSPAICEDILEPGYMLSPPALEPSPYTMFDSMPAYEAAESVASVMEPKYETSHKLVDAILTSAETDEQHVQGELDSITLVTAIEAAAARAELYAGVYGRLREYEIEPTFEIVKYIIGPAFIN
jgi:hypothetical protein